MITFVLPVYNGQNTIAKCIQSLLDQKLRSEIIVIDDASTDNTPRILEGFRNKVILVTNKERKGAAYCRNVGNRMASEEIIAVCDADMYFPYRSECIAKFFHRYRRGKNKADVFFSGLVLQDANDPTHQVYQCPVSWDFNSKCTISHPTVAYRKKVALECPYHEVTIETDLYEFMLLDAHRKGFIFGGAQDSLMCKIEGDSHRNKSKANALKMEMYKKYGLEVRL